MQNPDIETWDVCWEQKLQIYSSGTHQAVLASTASFRTTRFGSSTAFASSLITVGLVECSISYRTIEGIFPKYLRAEILTFCER